MWKSIPGSAPSGVLDFWVVDDCGTVINPLLVDEQIRGGVVQGIGAALYEQCIYGETGSWRTAASPTISCRWRARCPTSMSPTVETPTGTTTLGARGVGEAGAVAARRPRSGPPSMMR